jgi:hypothetical protein
MPPNQQHMQEIMNVLFHIILTLRFALAVALGTCAFDQENHQSGSPGLIMCAWL